METTVKTVEYLGLQCMVITRDDVNYYNVNNWGTQTKNNSRTYSNWKLTIDAQEKIQACKKESGLDEVILDKTKLRNEHRGMYVYDNLAILIAMWIDNEFGIRVAKLVNEGVKRELHFKYGSIIKMKDDKIDNLLKEVEDQKRKIDEMMRDNKQIMKQTEQVIIEDKFILQQIVCI